MIQKQKGTKDVLPSESYKWEEIESILKKKASLFGCNEFRTPTFEATELFLRSVGDTTDIVQKEMYTFLDKGNKSITLKPEGTASIVRSLIENSLYNNAQPTKIFYITPVFRYENPQSGRLREHHQFGCEIFGAKSASVDAEIISMVNSILTDSFKLENVELFINNIGCEKCRENYTNELKKYLLENYESLCENCKVRFEKNPLRVLDCKIDKCKEIAKESPSILDNICEECSSHFEELKKYLDILNIKYTVNPRIVRGLDYYTKTVFEFIYKDITVCGGGRYDNLVKEIGDIDLPAVGFGMGIERLLIVLEESGFEFNLNKNLDLYIGSFDEKSKNKAFELMAKCRENGIITDINHLERNLKPQMRYANNIGAKYTLIIGEDEIANNTGELKNMETGEKIKVSIDTVDDILKEVKR